MSEYTYFDWSINAHVIVPENSMELYQKYQQQDKTNRLNWIVITDTSDGDQVWSFYISKAAALQHESNVKRLFEKLPTQVLYMNHNVRLIGEVV